MSGVGVFAILLSALLMIGEGVIALRGIGREQRHRRMHARTERLPVVRARETEPTPVVNKVRTWTYVVKPRRRWWRR